MPKRTYQPSKIKRVRQSGYRSRKKTKKGKLVIKRRILRGRKKISA